MRNILPILAAFALTVVPAFAESFDNGNAVTGNPAAVDEEVGSGKVGEWIGLKPDWGVRVGGVWLGDFNVLMAGGEKPGSVTWQSLLLVGLTIDTEKAVGWQGGMIGAQFLRYDGQNVNGFAGSVQGYNSLESVEPLRRSELYQLWVRQNLFGDRLQIRVGKMVPTIDFTNVAAPIPVDSGGLAVPALSGLLFTPLYVNPSQIGVIPGYYNSAWGAVAKFLPNDNFSLSYGIYDGAGARGVQTGMDVGPTFGGYYFQIAEAGASWSLAGHLGRAGIGGWFQSGELKAAGASENGIGGGYAFMSQTLWQGSSRGAQPAVFDKDGKNVADKAAVDQGIIAFGQFGTNTSETLPMNTFLGGGLTAFGLVPYRISDSFGFGVSTSWLNPRLFQRRNELMFQTYYQASICDGFFLEPAFTYIPTPGASKGLGGAWAFTLRTTILF